MADFNKVKFDSYIQAQVDKSLVDIEYIMAYSLLDANIEPVKLIPYILEAQSLELEPVIGTALVNKLLTGTGGYAYQVLLEQFVKPTLLHHALSSYLTVAPFSVAEGGVYQHTSSEASVTPSKQVSVLINRENLKAKTYGDRMVEFLNKNSSRYPEYSQCVADGLKASKQQTLVGGLVMDLTYHDVTEKPLSPLDIPKGVVYPGNGGCGAQVCNPSDDFFVATTYWGNSTEADITLLDPNTLTNMQSDIPNYVYAQPEDNYFWLVSESNLAIGQMGTDIPLDPYSNTNPEEGVYVWAFYNDLYYIRVKMASTYINPVQFTVRWVN